VLNSQWRTTQGQLRRYYVLNAEGVDLYRRLTASWRGLNKAMDRLLEGERCDDG
jgi:PadR family transcriptional regulator